MGSLGKISRNLFRTTEGGRRPSEAKPIPGYWGRPQAVRSQSYPGPLRAAVGRPNPNLSRTTEGGCRPSEAKPILDHWGRSQAVRSQTSSGQLRAVAGRPKPILSRTTEGGRRPSEAIAIVYLYRHFWQWHSVTIFLIKNPLWTRRAGGFRSPGGRPNQLVFLYKSWFFSV